MFPVDWRSVRTSVRLETVMTVGIFSCQQSLLLQLSLLRPAHKLLSDWLRLAWGGVERGGRLYLYFIMFGNLKMKHQSLWWLLAVPQLKLKHAPFLPAVAGLEGRRNGHRSLENFLPTSPHAGETCFVIRAVRLISSISVSPHVYPW